MNKKEDNKLKYYKSVIMINNGVWLTDSEERKLNNLDSLCRNAGISKELIKILKKSDK